MGMEGASLIRHLSLEDVWASRKKPGIPRRNFTVRLSDSTRERLEAQAMRLRAHGRSAYAATLGAELIERGLDALEADSGG